MARPSEPSTAVSAGTLARAALGAHLLCYLLPVGLHVLQGDGLPVVVSSATNLERAGTSLYLVGVVTQTLASLLVLLAVWRLTRHETPRMSPLEGLVALLLMPGAFLIEVASATPLPPPLFYGVVCAALALATAIRAGFLGGPETAAAPHAQVRLWACLVFGMAVLSQVSNTAAGEVTTGWHAVTVRAATTGLLGLIFLLRPRLTVWGGCLMLNTLGTTAMAFCWFILGGTHPLGLAAEALTLVPLFVAIVQVTDHHTNTLP